MPHLRTLTYQTPPHPVTTFPFTIPALKNLTTLDLSAPVTFFIGENGSGKSTVIESLALSANLPTVGSESVDGDPTLAALRPLAKCFKLAWSKKATRGFFLRAEDFFGFAKRQSQIRAEMEQDIADIREEYKGRSKTALGLALMPYGRELGDMKRLYGDGLDTQSHGESFFKLFQARFVPNGLYLLDEPEAPLSPLRQMALLAQIHAMLAHNAQFIIATHSPILMAYPGARLYTFDGGTIQPINYEDTEHVRVTRAFLDNPQSALKHLFEPHQDD
jgi:predicted ATPase